jgi:hypothetical protein
VKNFFSNSTPTMGYNTKFSMQSLDFQLMVINSIARREREKHAHNKDTKSAKLEQLRSARLTHRTNRFDF